MTKLNFIYIGNDWDGNPKDNLPKDKVYVLKVKFDDDKMHYVPIIPFRDEKIEDIEETWVPGHGWYKLKNRKIYELPVYDGSVEHFKEYLETYGDEVMQYCINGDIFCPSWDCCNIIYADEYNAIKRHGPEEYNDFALHFKRLLKLQKDAFNERYMPLFKKHGSNEKVINNYVIRPDLNFGFSLFSISVLSLDVVADDRKMEKLYERIRYWELYESHNLYPEYLKRKKRVEVHRANSKFNDLRWDMEYNELIDKAGEIDHTIYTEVMSQVKDEINNGCEGFPISVKDRLIAMFGNEVNEEYHYILTNFAGLNDKQNLKTN